MAWVSEVIQNANLLCGSAMDHKVVTMCAQMILDRFKFRTMNALILAMKYGLNSGKIYGKLTYPVIAQWLSDHEEAVEGEAYRDHLGSK